MKRISANDPADLDWRVFATLNYSRNKNTILPHLRAANRYPDLLSCLGFRIDAGQHDFHKDRVKQADIFALLDGRCLVPEPAKAKASSAVYVRGAINKVLQSLAPFIRGCSTGGDVSDFIADLADEVGGPLGAVVAPCPP